MLYNMLMAVGGIVALFAAWVWVQSFVRRHDPEMDELQDVLACRMCGPDGSCHCGLRERSSGGAKTRVGMQ